MSKRIALIEDEPAIRKNYEDALTKQGYSVSSYDNRGAAIQAFQQRLPDLAIIDISLGDDIEGGYELCRNLRSKSTTLPIIFLTARDSDFDVISGLRLGADVPIFLYGHAAWAEGIGEKLTPIEPVESWYLIIYPGCHVPTADVFKAVDLTRNTPAITIRDFLWSGGHNDCEAVVRHRFPAVAGALDWLRKRADASMTGSGSSVFAGFDSHDQAAAVFDLIPPAWQGFIARGLNRSPLLQRLELESK